MSTDSARHQQIQERVEPTAPIRIWVAHCPFKKSGFPSLGTFGASVKPIVIMHMETWQKLCREIPELAARQFEVGSQE
jgi:hypothetical protein